MCDHHSDGSSFTMGMILGALIGAAAGILLAPGSGEETREALGTESRLASKKLKKKAAEIAEAAEPYLEDLAEQWDDLAAAAGDKAGEVRDDVEEFVAEHEPEVKREVKKATRPLKKLFK